MQKANYLTVFKTSQFLIAYKYNIKSHIMDLDPTSHNIWDMH